jgi:hypothetical protein
MEFEGVKFISVSFVFVVFFVNLFFVYLSYGTNHFNKMMVLAFSFPC